MAKLANAKGLAVKTVASGVTEGVSATEVIRRVGLIGSGIPPAANGGPVAAELSATAIAEACSQDEPGELGRLLRSLGYEPVWIDLERSADPFQELKAARLDVAVRIGAIQSARFSWALGLLEALQIPYVGSGASALSRCEDRIESESVLRHSNLATLPSYRLTRAQEASLADFQGLFGFPVHLSGARGAVSVPHECSDLARLQASVAEELVHSETVVVVKQLSGARFYASLFNEEVLAVAAESAEHSELAVVGSTRWLGLVHMARRAARSLGCAGLSLVELLVTVEMNEYVVRVEPSPSLSLASPYVQTLRAGGHELASVMRRLLNDARLEFAGASEVAVVSAIPPAGIRAA